MKISIVTISYNQGRFLEECIQSVLQQAYPDIEYIIVDPGSTDGSRDIIERYRDRIDKIIFEPDQGPADGLNKGFSVAAGDVFGYLNADDTYLPGTVMQMSKLFSANQDVDVIYGHARIINGDGRLLRRSFSDPFDLNAFAYGACQIMQASAFFRSRVWVGTGGFNIANRSNWDAELWHDICDAGGVFLLVDRFFSNYRVHAESITGSKNLDQQILLYNRRRFCRAMGRGWTNTDNIRRLIWRIRKYMISPRSFLERVRYGAVYGRGRNS